MEDKYENKVTCYKPANYSNNEINKRLGLYYPKWLEMLEEYFRKDKQVNFSYKKDDK